ncbi:MAG: IS1595 family transposase [Micrococcales bacterium]|nr:IS1595 family transposase [Micrococcales bacterium]
MVEPTDRPVAGVDYPSRLAQLRAWFATDADCLDYLDWLRWPAGFVCPHCGDTASWRGEDGRRRCRGCDRRVSVTAGTIFQGTRTPLTVWFEAVWLMTVPKNGTSALNLSRVLPIGSYQTSWTMLAKLRSAMSCVDKDKLSGTVEVDEWFHGGVARGGTALTGKNLVVAAVEHGPKGHGYGRVRFGIVSTRSTWELRKVVRAVVVPGALVITDGLSAYQSALAGYRHEVRNESAPDADDPHVLLPGVHRVFSLAERWLLGTHQGGVKREHLQEYLDEFAFRWNRRHASNRGMLFYRLLQHAVAAAPVTYKDLVRVGDAKPVTPAPPGSRALPGTLEADNAHRPWRQRATPQLHPDRSDLRQRHG